MLILIVEGDTPKKYRFNKEDKSIFLGRVFTNDIILNDKLISSIHGRIEKKKDTYFYEDLMSTNGSIIKRDNQNIFLKDNSEKNIILKDKDILILGNSIIKCFIKEN